MSSNQRTPEQEALAEELWRQYGERYPLPMYTASREHVWHEFCHRGYKTEADIRRFLIAVSYDEWYAAEHQGVDQWPVDWKPGKSYKYINFYETSECYGGPEEGGWYYTVGDPIASVPIRADATPDEIEASYHELCNRLGFEKDRRGHEYRIESEYGQPFPREQPHYE